MKLCATYWAGNNYSFLDLISFHVLVCFVPYNTSFKKVWIMSISVFINSIFGIQGCFPFPRLNDHWGMSYDLLCPSLNCEDIPPLQRKWSQGASEWKKRLTGGVNGWENHNELWEQCEKSSKKKRSIQNEQPHFQSNLFVYCNKLLLKIKFCEGHDSFISFHQPCFCWSINFLIIWSMLWLLIPV